MMLYDKYAILNKRQQSIKAFDFHYNHPYSLRCLIWHLYRYLADTTGLKNEKVV